METKHWALSENVMETVALAANDASPRRQQWFTSVAGRSRFPLACFQTEPSRFRRFQSWAAGKQDSSAAR